PHSMPARFLYLDNSGSPTQWDGTRYFDYLAKVRARLPSDLQSLTAKERYELPSGSDLSLWRSNVTYIQANRDGITFGAINDYGTRRFEFAYSGICKFQTTSNRLYFMPAIVVQELVKLRNGLLRHTISDMRGDFTTIHASSLSFQESLIK
ncbi:hypothetical protein J5837_07675, partial [Pseudoxanthomonas helianthi]